MESVFLHDLVLDKSTAHWVSWLKLVKLVRFVTRRSFDSSVTRLACRRCTIHSCALSSTFLNGPVAGSQSIIFLIT